jgi:hypothetical protein
MVLRCGELAVRAITCLPRRSKTVRLFDDIVGNGEHARRNGEAKRLGGLEVDDQFELGRLYDRQQVVTLMRRGITDPYCVDDRLHQHRSARLAGDISVLDRTMGCLDLEYAATQSCSTLALIVRLATRP